MMKFTFSILLAIGSLIGLALAGVAYVFLSTPRPTGIRGCLTTKMYHVHLCPSDKSYVRLGAIAPNVKNAVIVSEDGSFYSHQGIDWFEMRESFEKDWAQGHFARGGSTITQQLAKNVYLTSEKSLLRKVREAIIAVQLEDVLSKDEILEKYLNVVEFDKDLYGIGPAARHYFGKSPSQLSIAEGAFLAFLLPSPERYSASFRKKKLTPFARAQMRQIVHRLLRYHKISEEEQVAALLEIDQFFGAAPPTTAPDDEAAPSMEEQGDDAAAIDAPAPDDAPADTPDKESQ